MIYIWVRKMNVEKVIKLHTPLDKALLATLQAGDAVLLSGTVYSARDAAHKKLMAMLKKGEPLPFPVSGQAIYHMGPCPARPGSVIGPCGPTTSGRMDKYTPTMLEQGLCAIIGKGILAQATVDVLVAHGAVYFAATGGAGTLYMSCVRTAKPAAFPDLGPEAVLELQIEDFPLIVAVDTQGEDLFRTGPEKYKKQA